MMSTILMVCVLLGPWCSPSSDMMIMMMMMIMFIIINATTTIARVCVYNTLPDKMLRYRNSIFVVL